MLGIALSSIIVYIGNFHFIPYNVSYIGNIMGRVMGNRLAIGKKIADTRKEMRKTQQQMADATGIFKTTLSKIENGRFTGSLDILERYLDSVGLQLTVAPKQHTLPRWDEIDDLFSEDK
ncbi:hypothetical protein SOASR014_04550 [Pectobacterium carotovorum subsp. carotovorum]|uniref:HTH cro/C1-type domain-containing protein n=2 Tax=Pectobacterium versatile TaxID=2488639 RepID=A0A855MNE0_9GAMM|nr:hypothetical protein F131LOC_00336 [Pectobacterium versatile]GKX36716.1 hypothetical protein SOASR014_04550 [Pectobacterium carotovorum subsp. carotovorum]GLX43034.1 hypothetical protein Pcaca01_07020 [Pectobacterium carotovorum subsp. carotovorum]